MYMGELKIKMVDLYKEYVCPFCGTIDVYKNYWIDDKSDFFRCKCCDNRMRREVLLADMSSYEWGLWLSLNRENYRSPHNRFSEKINFKLIKFNLKNMGGNVEKEFYRGYYYVRDNELIEVKSMLENLNFKLGIWKKFEKRNTLDRYSA